MSRCMVAVGIATGLGAALAPSVGAQDGHWRRRECRKHSDQRECREYHERHGSSGGLRLGAYGGATLPVSTTARGMDAGWTAGAVIDFTVPSFPLGLRLDGSYQRARPSGATATGSFQVWGGDLDVILTVPGRLPFRPYLIAGPGLYGTKSSIASSPSVARAATITSHARFALNGGVGVRSEGGGVGAFLEARYLYIYTPHTRTRLVPVLFGIVIGSR